MYFTNLVMNELVTSVMPRLEVMVNSRESQLEPGPMLSRIKPKSEWSR